MPRRSPSRARPRSGDAGRLSVSVIATDAHDAEGVDTFFLDVVPERDTPTAPIVVIRRVPVSPTGTLATLITWSAGKEATEGRAKYELQIRSAEQGQVGQVPALRDRHGPHGSEQEHEAGTYQLRLRATPAGGKAGAWIEGTPFTLRLGQESDRPSTTRALGQGVRQGRLGWRGPAQPQAWLVVHGDRGRRQHRAGHDLRQGPGHHRGLPRRRGHHTGGCRTIDLGPGKRTPRNVVTIFRGLDPSEHTVTVTVREGPVELDGIVVQSTPAP